MKFIKFFKEISYKDVPLVGGKNASLGEMVRSLSGQGVSIPDGFAVTAAGYKDFIEFNSLARKIKILLKNWDGKNIVKLRKIGLTIRTLIRTSDFSPALAKEIKLAYEKLGREYGNPRLDVAVRSSATAEDLPTASFAGEQESFLNVRGEDELLKSIRSCFASLFTNRAISYRQDRHFDHLKIFLSVGVQKMVRSDRAASGVIFTLDPDSGFRNVVVINSIYGLGELIVQGEVIPDEFQVFKPTNKIIFKKLGQKNRALVYDSKKRTKLASVSRSKQNIFSLNDKEVLSLAKSAELIEKHYSRSRGRYQAMDIEWAKDGLENKLYIVQARPETIHSVKKQNVLIEQTVEPKGRLILEGISVGSKSVSGRARVITDIKQIDKFKPGEILITTITDPDWEPIMKIARGIITDLGGRTSHAAIVSRELGIAAIVGSFKATKLIKTGQLVTIDCSSEQGRIYAGSAEIKTKVSPLERLPGTKTKIMVNVGMPSEAFKQSFLPVQGVGLAREEFIIAASIGIHPRALLDYPNLPLAIKKKVEALTSTYKNKKEFYVEKLTFGIGQIAAAFYPNEVIIRFSDFKTNEYKNLIGGELYEPKEENPMLGWRGASRYYDPNFKAAFDLEVEAIRRARDDFGLKNISVLVPFCRTVEEGKKVIESITKFIPRRRIKIYAMAEIPSNVIVAQAFLKIFDGFSIGSNDLTQLVFGLDRDNQSLAGIANENQKAMRLFLADLIKTAKRLKKYIGICGQAPSDYLDFALFLVKNGIDSISLNPDSVVKTLLAVAKLEKSVRNRR